MKKLFSSIKKGLTKMKDKTVETIVNVGVTLKSRENRIIIGLILVGLGGGLIVSGYIPVPQEI